jgi:hypothetical protein
MLPARMIWLVIFVCWPIPAPPHKLTARLYFSIIGLTLVNTSLSPPHIVTSFPSLAPTSPPDTGASTLPTPNSRASLWICVARLGRLVVWSTNIALHNRHSYPFFMYLKMPDSPSTMLSTSLGNPSIRNSTSTCEAIYLGSAQVAPMSRRG